MAVYMIRGAEGRPVEVTRERYRALIGDRTTAPYAAEVRSGRMDIAAVPETVREAVADIVAAREAYFGAYQIPAAQALRELEEVLQ